MSDVESFRSGLRPLELMSVSSEESQRWHLLHFCTMSSNFLFFDFIKYLWPSHSSRIDMRDALCAVLIVAQEQKLHDLLKSAVSTADLLTSAPL